MLKIANPRLGLSSTYPVASEIAYNGTQTGLPGNVQDAITQLDTNINIISNDYETKEVFTDISGETSGTVETYANISIMQEEWANEDNAIAVAIVEGKPSEKFLFTDEGEIVRAIIDAYGNYTLNGIPTATNYAICYLLRGTKSAFGLAEIPQSNIISEYDFDSPYVVNGTDIEPTNLNYNHNLKNGGLKDSFVSTAIKLGDALNTAFSTVNKTIVGAINELKSAIANCLTAVSTDTTLTGNGTVASPLGIKLDNANTWTNQSLDVDNNTLSNVETDNFKTGVIDTDNTLSADSDTRLSTQKAIKAFVARYMILPQSSSSGTVGYAIKISSSSGSSLALPSGGTWLILSAWSNDSSTAISCDFAADNTQGTTVVLAGGTTIRTARSGHVQQAIVIKIA